MSRRYSNVALHEGTFGDRPLAHVVLTDHAIAMARARLGLDERGAHRAAVSAVTNGVVRRMRQGSHRWWAASGSRIWVMEQQALGWRGITVYANWRWRVRMERREGERVG